MGARRRDQAWLAVIQGASCRVASLACSSRIKPRWSLPDRSVSLMPLSRPAVKWDAWGMDGTAWQRPRSPESGLLVSRQVVQAYAVVGRRRQWVVAHAWSVGWLIRLLRARRWGSRPACWTRRSFGNKRRERRAFEGVGSYAWFLDVWHSRAGRGTRAIR